MTKELHGCAHTVISMQSKLLNTYIAMGCKTTLAEVAWKASNGQVRNENIGTFIKLILSTKASEWCKGYCLSYPQKGESNVKSAKKLRHTSDNHLGTAGKTPSSTFAEATDFYRSPTYFKKFHHCQLPTSKRHQPFHGSLCGNYRKNTFAHHRILTIPFSRSYSTSANESHKASSNEYSWDHGPSLDPDSVTASSILHDEEEDRFKGKYDITAEEFESVIADLQPRLLSHSSVPNNEKHVKGTQGSLDEGWMLEWEGSGVVIWSRLIEGKDYLQYKIEGHYDDIPPIAFFYIQMNIAHRQHWDTNTDAIEIFDTRDASQTELVYWRVNFPRLMAKRDYTIARRHLVDLERNMMVLYNKAVYHPDRPINKKYVRVTDYDSQMLIRPEKGITQNGFDFILTYTDDTKTNMPQYALRRLIRSGLPQFLGSIHQASRTLAADYRKFKSSGEAISQCRDERVKELCHIIEQAEDAERKRQLIQSVGDDDDMESAEWDEYMEDAEESVSAAKHQIAEETRTRVLPAHVPLRKISPPEYLPDWRAYLEGVVADGRLTPIPLKRVHSPKHQSPSGYCRDWSS
ncbi:uncharacterized protein [Watersipora subatra]|uniref:uncharacterized protein n=1 Tax=Watersipora subatra TaxID=2589382 RepID=UPI00355C4139